MALALELAAPLISRAETRGLLDELGIRGERVRTEAWS